MRVLPRGWEWVTLGDVVWQMKNGYNAKPSKTRSSFKVTRIETISTGKIDLDRVGYLPELPTDIAEKHAIKKGDILFSHINSDPHLGKTAICTADDPNLVHGVNLLLLRPFVDVEPKYIELALRDLRAKGYFVKVAQHAVNQSSINQKVLAQAPLPLPPRAEQERIVNAIEEHLSRLDAGVSALNRVRQHLKRARAAVLGERYSDAAHQFGTEALTRVIGTSALFIDGDWVESKDQDPGGDHRLTQLADVGDGVWRNRSSRFMNPEQFHRLDCTELQKGDILVARMPDPLGRACLFPGDTMPCATVVDVVIIRPVEGQADARWLMWMLNAPQVRNQVAALAKGTTRRRISRRNLGLIQIPRLGEPTQRTQVHELERSLDAIARMEDAISAATVSVAALRSSILSAATSGKLVPQAPKDEPASILLERIATRRLPATERKPGRNREVREVGQEVRR